MGNVFLCFPVEAFPVPKEKDEPANNKTNNDKRHGARHDRERRVEFVCWLAVGLAALREDGVSARIAAVTFVAQDIRRPQYVAAFVVVGI